MSPASYRAAPPRVGELKVTARAVPTQIRVTDSARCLTASAETAEVRSAVALTADQQDRLRAALANATGRNVDLKVNVDPSVLGGLVATVGDTIIDGSIRTRLDQLKSLL